MRKQTFIKHNTHWVTALAETVTRCSVTSVLIRDTIFPKPNYFCAKTSDSILIFILRNDYFEEGDDTRLSESPVANDWQENDTETTIALLSRVNNYKYLLCNQKYNQNLFEDKNYPNLPHTEEDDKTLGQMDIDNVDLDNENSSC